MINVSDIEVEDIFYLCEPIEASLGTIVQKSTNIIEFKKGQIKPIRSKLVESP